MEQLVEDLKSAAPTYSEIGATLAGRRPEGFRHDRYEAVLGQGHETFQRAVTGLKTWKAHRLPGMGIFPNQQEIFTGATVVVTLGTPVVALAVPCRIVSLIDGQIFMAVCVRDAAWSSRAGRGGVHRFHVDPDQTVRFEIREFPDPGSTCSAVWTNRRGHSEELDRRLPPCAEAIRRRRP